MDFPLLKTEELTEIQTEIVALVKRGANGKSRFWIAKTDAPALDVDATDEERESARAIRSDRYGIAVLEKGTHPAPQENTPTLEEGWADPVNLLYPLGGSSNELDAKVVEKSLEEFDPDAYPAGDSARYVAERLAANATLANVAIHKEHPILPLLTDNLKKKIVKADTLTNETENDAPPTGVDLGEFLKPTAMNGVFAAMRKAIEDGGDVAAGNSRSDQSTADSAADSEATPQKVDKKESAGASDDKSDAETVAKSELDETQSLLAKTKQELAEAKRESADLKAQLVRKMAAVDSSSSLNTERTAPVTKHGEGVNLCAVDINTLHDE